MASNMRIIPVEVKAGTSGKMKSLREFMNRKNISYAVRTSLENFGRIDQCDPTDPNKVRQIDIRPIYALSALFAN